MDNQQKKTAEEQAKENYPRDWQKVRTENGHPVIADKNFPLRKAFADGYDFAAQESLEKDKEIAEQRNRIAELEDEVTSLRARFLPCNYPKCGCIRGQYKCV